MAQGERRLGPTQVLERLTAATELTADTIYDAAILAAKRAALDTGAMVVKAFGAGGMVRAASGAEGMVRAAFGAASMALHELTLARLTGCGPDHLFMRKYRLFESGRWPLGVLRGAFHLYLSPGRKQWLTPS